MPKNGLHQKIAGIFATSDYRAWQIHDDVNCNVSAPVDTADKTALQATDLKTTLRKIEARLLRSKQFDNICKRLEFAAVQQAENLQHVGLLEAHPRTASDLALPHLCSLWLSHDRQVAAEHSSAHSLPVLTFTQTMSTSCSCRTPFSPFSCIPVRRHLASRCSRGNPTVCGRL